MVEDNLHMFSLCSKVKIIVSYFRTIVEYVCDIKSFNMNKVLYLQNIVRNKVQCNTLIVLTSSFISTMWYNRDNDKDIELAWFK